MSSILVKRPREDDGLDGVGDFGIKKSRLDRSSNITSYSSSPLLPRQLPFNNSTTLSPPLEPIEPAREGSYPNFEDAIPESFRLWREERKQQSHSSLHTRRPSALTVDVDTAMDVDMVPRSPFPNGDNLSPWPVSARLKASNHLQPSPIPHHLLNQSLTISGGRTSTPIYSHFTLNMKTELMGNAPRTPNAVSVSSPTIQSESESNWRRRRRLPSPISEAGDDPAELEAESSLNDPNDPLKETEENEKDLPDSPSSMDVDDEIPSNTFLQVPEQKIEIPTHLPEKAETEVKTPQKPTQNKLLASPRRDKITFSMGYRADCEKCQLKVPGHYSHIVRSH